MKLVFPTIEYKEKALDFINEFYIYNSPINGTGSLDNYLKEASYEAWLNKVIKDIDMANIPLNRVPALTYFYVCEEDDKIIGMINLRLALTDFLRTSGGHVGYCIRPTERRKHYATSMLEEALKIYDMLGIKEVIVTCDKGNPASSGVIKNCRGVFEEEFFSDYFKVVIQRYVIKR